MAASIFVTDEVNDRDLLHHLGSLAVSLPIPHGDACWFGALDSGESIRVCLERKKITDLCNSIIGGRYLHQAQEAKEAGMDYLILVVEGQKRCSPLDGFLEVPGYDKLRKRRGWKQVIPPVTYSRFAQYLHELHYLAGIEVVTTDNVRETAAVVKALWLNFQTAPSKHNSLHQIYRQPHPVSLVRPTLIRRMASEIDGIGWERSKSVADRFPTVREMVEAGVDEWSAIPGIGKVTAKKAVESLNGQAG